MNKLIILLILLFAMPASADYTIDLKNESGVVLKIYPITSAQVLHLKKVQIRTNKTVLN